MWYNRNKFLKQYDYATGGKNGYTPSAGKTLVTTAEKYGLRLTAVTLKDANQYETHANLYDYLFEKYKSYTIVDKDNFEIKNNFYKDNLYLKKSFKYPLMEEEKSKIKTIFFWNTIKTPSIVILFFIKVTILFHPLSTPNSWIKVRNKSKWSLSCLF
mgnify:FL=1